MPFVNRWFFWGCCVALVLLSCRRPGLNVTNILVKGSDTEVNLALALAEQYMQKDSLVSIAVTGGGSGMGIAALINGKTDIANSSRPMKSSEIELAQERGVNPVATVFAVDALAILVNENLPIDTLRVEDVRRMFVGELTNWSEIGGPDQKISLYGRQSNSGTYVYFRDSILKQEYAMSLKQMNGTAQIVEAIRNDPGGIGYVGVGYILDKSREISAGLQVPLLYNQDPSLATSPVSESAIRSGRYPIVRPLFQYTDGQPSGKLLDFIRFGLSAAGQEIVSKNGYYPISPALMARNERVLGIDLQ